MTTPIGPRIRAGLRAPLGAPARRAGGLLALALVAGCMGAGDPPPETAIPSEADDGCAPFRQPLAEAKVNYLEKIAIPAVTGAASGAALSALIAGVQSGDADVAKSAAIGAGVGALSGAALGYLNAVQEENATRDAVLKAIDEDIGETKDHASEVGRAVRALNMCRADRAAEIRAGLASGALTADQGQAELATMRRRIGKDRALVDAVVGEVEGDADLYRDVTAATEGVEKDLVLAKETTEYKPAIIADPGGARGIGFRWPTKDIAVRSAPDADAPVVARMAKGRELLVIGESGTGWSQIDRDGAGGWVDVTELTATKPVAPAPVTTTPAETTEGAATTETTSAAAPKPEPVAQEIPVVDRAKQPPTEDPLDALFVEAANIRAEDSAFEAQIAAELDALEALAS